MKIIIYVFLSLLILCKPSSKNTESTNTAPEEQGKKGCMNFAENEFASSIGSNQFCFTSSHDINCEHNALVLQSDGNGSYSTPEVGFPLKWKKEGNSITFVALYNTELFELRDCHNKMSAGVFDDQGNDENKRKQAYENCLKEVRDQHGKESTDFNITGSITQNGKKILLSMEGNDAKPLEGKKKAEYTFSKKNEEVCAIKLK